MAGSVYATHATKIAITVPLEIVIADQPAREADQDRPEGCEPRPVRHVPDGPGRVVLADVPGNPARLSPGCGHRPRQHEKRGDQMRQTTTAKVRLDAGKLRVLAPRRSQLIGSTLLRTRCAIYVARDRRRGDPSPRTTPNPEIVGLRPSDRPVSLLAPRAAMKIKF